MKVRVVRGEVGIVVGIAALLSVGIAEAKFEAGGRTGFAIPIGKAAGDAEDLSENLVGQIPFWVDLGARIGEQTFVGGYLEYGTGLLKGDAADACDDGSTCRVSALRLGFEALYHFGGLEQADPWVGGGTGFEVLSIRETFLLGAGQSAEVTSSAWGWEFLNVQAGADFRLSRKAALGPFAAFTIGQFQSRSIDCSGNCGSFNYDSEDIEDKTIHYWVFFGIRATFLP